MRDIQCTKWSMGVILVAALLWLAGCSVPSFAPGETPQPTNTPLFAPSLVVLTQTLSAQSPTPTLTPRPTRTPTPTPCPTLTADEEYAYVSEMLATNAGCELPCWWGITPGKSSWQEARNQLPRLNFQFWFLEEHRYDVHFTLTEAEGVIESIRVSGDCACFVRECERFAQDWSHYALDQILSRYGPPSRARIIFPPTTESGAPVYYNLYLVYDELGISIAYTGDAIKQGEMRHTCFSFCRIQLWLQPSGSSLPLLERGIGQEAWEYAVPLDAVTGMSLEEFYEVFRHPEACLTVPATHP